MFYTCLKILSACHVLVALLVFPVITFAQDSVFTVDSHTRALWRFNEGGGDTAYDESGYGNHMGLVGSYGIYHSSDTSGISF
ncbi:MAG: hypothetical protein A2268_01400 [Candidatus Raymondbacteria bacterium RifOxyA12_full_50_37]|uniref:Uncharacterized protein n=1 Tax=Candidatus Raymondbacteria bacterium RIFOXYD12_FULL_49_13 TaxID=1817890 RepID=A0A1F7FJ49_UNCRA|nr:MAG: hypothetical protein A2268_01400 [Candidatus Raymondbacteria bacterium RifOxyA12_full_50_37]OGJ87954.1 MAG: hypothetical protein A2248_01935 [Candidatus Raymondbacteria bacterium RIFOXYA2_FULL_49_16]OGJ88015.1 MAG: hypothetical protein A2350_00950 [Candidatus Raymondbacteria bacterium RifOxyB12_full_50_8]OGJ95619.1 MAG: hypothetical protein A2453_13095 [Candidatus Raymondbacteria bacterium RIFOXYC2_FULL_50_21]OGJ97637.1 MAG: hypothetical protein A2487_12965 [Candidatus Raymondbacteria b